MQHINHHNKFLCHQLGLPPLLSWLINIFLVSSHKSKNIENPRPGIPRTKKLSGLPPNTELTPGTYSKKMNKIVSARTPPNMCLLKPEYMSDIYVIIKLYFPGFASEYVTPLYHHNCYKIGRLSVEN